MVDGYKRLMEKNVLGNLHDPYTLLIGFENGVSNLSRLKLFHSPLYLHMYVYDSLSTEKTNNTRPFNPSFCRTYNRRTP